MIERPQSHEYAAEAAGYVSRVPQTDIIEYLAQQVDALREAFAGVSDAAANQPQAPGKWSLKQELGHIIDGERVFAYRALSFLRGERAQLASYDQDEYMKFSDFHRRTLADMLEEFALLRQANLLQFRNITPEEALRSGTAAGHTGVTVRALLYVMAGHTKHHLDKLAERRAAKA